MNSEQWYIYQLTKCVGYIIQALPYVGILAVGYMLYRVL